WALALGVAGAPRRMRRGVDGLRSVDDAHDPFGELRASASRRLPTARPPPRRCFRNAGLSNERFPEEARAKTANPLRRRRLGRAVVRERILAAGLCGKTQEAQMGGQAAELTGPDLARGIPLTELRHRVPLLGHAHGEAVVVARDGERIYAVGATCTHYGG